MAASVYRRVVLNDFESYYKLPWKKVINQQYKLRDREDVYIKPERKFTWNEFSFWHETNSVYISFHCGRNKINLLCFWSVDLLPLFLWNIRMHRCFLPNDLILGWCFDSIYHPTLNLISAEINAMKTRTMSFISRYFM